MRSGPLVGTWRLVRFSLRRDRVRLAIWVIGLAGVITTSAASLLDVYPTQAAIDSYVRLFGDNPALVVFAGPGFGFDDPNIGVVLVNETQLWGMIGVSLMSIFVFNRHTRAEEDSERLELIRSLAVGRHAPVAAATVVVSAANIVVSAVTGAAFVALDYPVAGSAALAGSYLAVGLTFIGLTAIAAQVAGSGRGTLGMASAALLGAFVVRAIGDVGPRWLTWCSPIGWAQAVRAFADEQWWTLALCASVAGALVSISFWLSTRRDLGAGLLARRPGRATASRQMTHPLGLSLRMARGLIAGWMVGLFVTGVVVGAIADDIDQMLADNPQMAEFFTQLEGASLIDTYLSTSLMMLGLIAAGLSITLVLVAHADESNGRAAWMLAGPLSRTRWLMSHLVTSTIGTLAAIGASGLGVGIAYAWVADDASQVLRIFSHSLVTVPAALVLAAVAAAMFGLAPRVAMLAWLPLVLSALVIFLGEVLQFPAWVRWVSPFEHVPILTGQFTGQRSGLPVAVLTAIALGCATLGWWGFIGRDVTEG